MKTENIFYVSKPLTFKYNIRIGRENTDFYQIKRELSRSLVDYSENYRRYKNFDKDEYFHNATYFVVNDLFQKRFLFSGNTNAYLTDYSENRGSLLISFTVLVVGAIANYGSIRETIDYFAEDIERLFANSLNNRNEGYLVTSSILELNGQSLSVLQQLGAADTDGYKTLLSKIKVDRVLIGIVFFLLILMFVQNYFADSDKPKQSEDNELKTRSIIRDEIRNQKIDGYINKPDTVFVKLK